VDKLAERLACGIAAGGIGPGLQVCGRELGVAQAQVGLLEQQSTQPPCGGAVVAVGLLVAQ
jgi:hypothetical protein